MEASRIRGAAMACGRTIGAWGVVAAMTAGGLLWAHRTVSQAAATLASAEARCAAAATTLPGATPPITASISTIASCLGEDISLERCRFSWRPARGLVFVRPDLRVAGEADSAEAIDRFVERLAAHAFLGEASIASLRSRRSGAIAFEIALGDEPNPIADSIVAQGGAR